MASWPLLLLLLLMLRVIDQGRREFARVHDLASWVLCVRPATRHDMCEWTGKTRHLLFLSQCMFSGLLWPLLPIMSTNAMRLRAKQIFRQGAYIGLFEWVAWAVHEKVDVQMLFGSNIVDLKAVFAPNMPQRSLSCLRVSAVRLSDDGKHWLSAVKASGLLVPDINHYVIGIACGLRPLVASGLVSSTSAVKEAMRAGWILRATEARGNCGIDCMSHHLGMPRAAPSWAAIRKKLADFMSRIADDPAWHVVFGACQEMPVRAAMPMKAGMGPSKGSLSAWAAAPSNAASASSGLALPAAVPGGLLPPDTSSPPAVSSTSAASSLWPAASAPTGSSTAAASSHDGAPSASVCPPLLPPPLPPPLEDPPLPSPLEQPLALVAAVPLSLAGPRPFAEWLNNLPAPDLLKITASVTEFVEAEAKWRAEHPKQAAAEAQPRRKKYCFRHQLQVHHRPGLSGVV